MAGEKDISKPLAWLDPVTESPQDWVITISNPDDGISYAIKFSDLIKSFPIANTFQNGMQSRFYAHSGDIWMLPNEVIDTGLNYGLLILNHPSSGNSIAFICAHWDLKAIEGLSYSFSLEDIQNVLYIYKEYSGGNVKIKNNYSENRLISYHIL